MAYDFSTLDAQINETHDWLQRELSGVRTGRAAPAILDSIKADAYGARTPLRELASITIEDARTLRVAPWDTSTIKAVEKSIVDADLGVGVAVDGQGVRVLFPELTSERRTQLLKIAGDRTEQARVTLRGHRTEAIKELEAVEKDGGMGQDEVVRLKSEIQKRIDAGNEMLAELLKKKEAEIAR